MSAALATNCLRIVVLIVILGLVEAWAGGEK